MSSHEQTHGDDYHQHVHISSIKSNVAVFGGLLFFTALTVLAYNVRLGDMNLTVAVIIASMKAVLVCTFFMHMKYEARFNVLFFLGAILFIAIFFGYSTNDTGHRGQNGSLMGVRVDPATGAFAYGSAPEILANNSIFQPLSSYGVLPPGDHGDSDHDSDHDTDSDADHDGEEATAIDTSMPGDADAGEAVYAANCVACHAADGRANGGMTGGDFVGDTTRLAQDNAVLLDVIANGKTDGNSPMPGWSASLTEDDMNDVLSYIRREFGQH